MTRLPGCFALFALLIVTASAAVQNASPPLEGFADIHLHQMDNVAFGGTVVWGAAYGDPSAALPPIPQKYRRGHDRVEAAVHVDGLLDQLGFAFGTFLPRFLPDVFKHKETGYPTFTSWPSPEKLTHQQVYEDWLFRAYRGGLRLMVVLATNSEDMFGRGENHLRMFRNKEFQKVKEAGRTGNDMEALEWQVREAYRMQAYIDGKYGGHGWYRIVRDPEEAGGVIARGELAVILGTELQHLFNCDTDRPPCTDETIVEGLNRLEAMGLNYVFPIHLKVNQFGGPAAFVPLNSGPLERCHPYRHKCSTVGLKDPGKFLIEELMARGMLIDTEHLSRLAFADAMNIIEARRYPVMASHVVAFDLARPSDQTERARTGAELRRVLGTGGMVAPLFGASARQYKPSGRAPVLISCRPPAGGGPDQWANAYLYLSDLAKSVNGEAVGHLAVGSDFNGFAGWPSPREKCKPLEGPVRYDFDLPPQLMPVPDPFGPVNKMSLYEWPAGRKWDYNKVGLANVGMEPDFLENVRLLGLTPAELEPIYRSARGVVTIWTTARNVQTPRDRHHLRWAPQSPFDVLEFTYFDKSRNVDVRENLPVCRSRENHALGFERNDRCELVEDASPTAPGPIHLSTYDAGRCLDLKRESPPRRAEQRTCEPGGTQLWTVQPAGSGLYQLMNSKTGQCLSVGFKVEEVPRLETCSQKNEQQWQAKRTGNTFSLIGKQSKLCLEIKDQSRADGAAIQQNKCSGASNQLWNIESLRTQDFERLYQADKGQTGWFDRAPDGYLAVAVDDAGKRPICRAQGSQWLGVVSGNQCRGKTFDGSTAVTEDFQQLFQRF